MSKLKISKVEEALAKDIPYSIMVDYFRLIQRYGTKAKFFANDPELIDILRCNSQTSVSTKLMKLYALSMAVRSSPTTRQMRRPMGGRIAFVYNMV